MTAAPGHVCPFQEGRADVINAADIEAKMLETSRQGAKEALDAVGLGNGGSAARDIRELRAWIQGRREDIGTLRATLVRLATTFAATSAAIGLAWMLLSSRIAEVMR